MKKISKVFASCFALAAAAIAVQPAQAAPFYSYPYFYNDYAGSAATITNVVWHGSYLPQMATTVPAVSSTSGTLKTTSLPGYTDLKFDASITDANNVVHTCTYLYSVANSTGVIATIAKAARDTEVYCEASQTSSNSVSFRINLLN